MLPAAAPSGDPNAKDEVELASPLTPNDSGSRPSCLDSSDACAETPRHTTKVLAAYYDSLIRGEQQSRDLPSFLRSPNGAGSSPFVRQHGISSSKRYSSRRSSSIISDCSWIDVHALTTPMSSDVESSSSEHTSYGDLVEGFREKVQFAEKAVGDGEKIL
ncbi:unnamed protein product [Gongylonema pulchrum]|uniref:Uncharacterized protein n=1 Tax=Gongylonema pulchrum TaxID=637853 RepID=A0A183DWZ1_9BILA|nr:unnamed protein product [Gongylonema pulchrum]